MPLQPRMTAITPRQLRPVPRYPRSEDLDLEVSAAGTMPMAGKNLHHGPPRPTLPPHPSPGDRRHIRNTERLRTAAVGFASEFGGTDTRRVHLH